jgi:hypothetical protein
MFWPRPSTYSSMIWRASSNRDDLDVAVSIFIRELFFARLHTRDGWAETKRDH